MRAVVTSLEDEGYSVRHELFNAESLLPQFRNRVYIFAFLDAAAAARFAFPALTEVQVRPLSSTTLCLTLGTSTGLSALFSFFLFFFAPRAYRDGPTLG